MPLTHHHPFVPGVLTNIFILLEPGLFAFQAEMSQFLQSYLHADQFCEYVLLKPLA